MKAAFQSEGSVAGKNREEWPKRFKRSAHIKGEESLAMKKERHVEEVTHRCTWGRRQIIKGEGNLTGYREQRKKQGMSK